MIWWYIFKIRSFDVWDQNKKWGQISTNSKFAIKLSIQPNITQTQIIKILLYKHQESMNIESPLKKHKRLSTAQIQNQTTNIYNHNLQTPNTFKYNKPPSNLEIFTFSKSKERKHWNKRSVTEPEAEEPNTPSNNPDLAATKINPQQKHVLEFDKLRFKKIKSQFKKKMENMNIKRENSNQFLLNLNTQKETNITYKAPNTQRTATANRQRRNKNMSEFIQPRPKTIFHRTQVSTQMVTLNFTEKPKKSAIPKFIKTDIKTQSTTIHAQAVFHSQTQVLNRKLSYLTSEPVYTNAIQAQFEQFLKDSQNKKSPSKQAKTTTPLQFTKQKALKSKNIPSQNKKYEYSTYYDQQINMRNSQVKPYTSRDLVKKSPSRGLASYRSTANLNNPSSLNSSKRILE